MRNLRNHPNNPFDCVISAVIEFDFIPDTRRKWELTVYENIAMITAGELLIHFNLDHLLSFPMY
jgi:hypothetical protein